MTMTEGQKRQQLTGNLAMYVIGWLACVLGGNGVAVVAVLLIVVLHLRYLSELPNEWRLLVQVSTLGFAFDCVLLRSGIVLFADHNKIAPLWMVCLWTLFSTLLLHALRWLQARWNWTPLLGALFGPLAYYLLSLLSALSLIHPLWQGLCYIALACALFLPLLVWMGRRIVENAPI